MSKSIISLPVAGAILAILLTGCSLFQSSDGQPSDAETPTPTMAPTDTLTPEPTPATAEDGVGVASDRAALVALYNATEGGSWITRTNWLSGRPLDEWHGVTTDSDGRVTALNLSSNSLYGALPAALGGLSNLTGLWLQHNQLTGEIPPELGGLSNLTELSLDNNQLTGEIPPELGGLSNLTGLWLQHNQLTGEIPPELGGLSNLTELSLDNNQLTGEIPPELGGLSNLTGLWLWGNQLTGEIPPELGGLSNLTELSLDNNQLTGEIPPELGGLSNLTRLWLHNNQLTGEIPPELGGLSNLEVLWLWGNQLTGEIPPELGGLSNLTELILDNNGLTGEIPAALGDLANLESLRLSDNQLTGGIPPELGGLSNLQSLWLRGNELTGCIPEGLRDIEANDLGDLDQQMIEAGCIDPDSVPDDYADVPDDHGNDIDSATVAAATLPLDVYLTLCALPEQELADDATFGELSSVLAAEADRLEALTPPAQLSEWHLLNIEAYRTVQAGVDTQPKDDVMVNNPTINAVRDDFVEKSREAAARVPKDVRQQMIEAGCINPDFVPDDDADVPDGQGNDIDSATVAAATLSLDVYLTLCAPPESDLADDATYGDLSSELATEADRVEALTPPAQLSEWHLLNIENYRTIQAVFDTYPKDDVIDFANLLLIAAAADELEGKLGEVAVRLPEDVLQRMIEAGCIDPGVAPYDYVNEFESATRIAIGEAVAIEFESPDDEGMFVFLGEPGAEYVFTLDWESWIRLSDPSRPIMVLFDAGGQELAHLEDDDSSQNMMMWQAVTGGDYYIAVGDGATFGSLALTVTVGGAAEPLDRDDHGNSEGEATAIRVGTDVPGVLDYDDDIDYFRFQAEQGQSYVVSLPQWSFSRSGTPPDSDAKTITLYDSAARQLANANLSSSPYGIAWVALNSEYIYIAIGEDGTYGSYTLTVAPDDHGHDPSTATSIAIAESVEFTLYGNDTDYLRFQAEAGQDYHVYIESLTSVWGGPRVAIHDSSGLELSSFGLDEEIIVESPGSGDYYIAATMEPEGFGGFTLVVFSSEDDHGDSVEDATAVEFGEPVRGVLYPEDDPDFFVFQAESGEFYEISVAGNLYDAGIDLYGSGEAHLESFGSKAVWKAGSAGEYYIEVTGYGSAPSYTLSVSVLEITDDHGGNAADASAITVGESIEGAVNYLGDEDVFLFQVEAGAIYEIEVAPGTLADPRLVLYDEPDEWKGRFYSPVLSVKTHRNVWRSEYTGDSYLVVGFPGHESGSYTIKVAKITLAGNTSYDSDDDGLIEVANLEQLDAIRWDLDGDGLPDSSSGMAGFAASFPGALDGMGCPDSECSGYELVSDLDFDTNGNGRADAGDAYWNDGEGWVPIGDDFEAAFETFFNGGGHTISNLYIDRRDAKYAGLFGNTGFSGSNYWGLNNNIRDLALVNVDVQGGTYTGGLVGNNGLVIVACSVTGVVSGGGSVGGLVGDNFGGTIIASYSAASVADGGDTGGLVGSNFVGRIIASYSIGSVSDYDGVSVFVDVGGLVGSNSGDRGTARDSYWDTQTSGQSESAGGKGKTTSELQSPTGYTGIYENWNLDLDKDGVGDDLWDFGNASQYPTLWHGT